mmetsp:Transcript_15859/g.50641  ORF Transcript_15859/g.50641 Transcript_15859/m.50641 type:complete len:201 (+) Transcript_15859:462-1064(+)
MRRDPLRSVLAYSGTAARPPRHADRGPSRRAQGLRRANPGRRRLLHRARRPCRVGPQLHDLGRAARRRRLRDARGDRKAAVPRGHGRGWHSDAAPGHGAADARRHRRGGCVCRVGVEPRVVTDGEFCVARSVVRCDLLIARPGEAHLALARLPLHEGHRDAHRRSVLWRRGGCRRPRPRSLWRGILPAIEFARGGGRTAS